MSTISISPSIISSPIGLLLRLFEMVSRKSVLLVTNLLDLMEERQQENMGRSETAWDDHEIEGETVERDGSGREVFAERGEALTTDLYVRWKGSR